MAMDPKRLNAAVAQIDQAAEDWLRCAASAKKAGNLDGAQMFEANAAEAERLAQGLVQFGPTEHSSKVASNVARRMVELDRKERHYKLAQVASRMKGTEQGLRAMLQLHGWSDEEGDAAYKKMRQKRPIADSLTAGRASAPASAGNPAADRQARIARQRRMTQTAGAAGSPAAPSAGGRWDDLLV